MDILDERSLMMQYRCAFCKHHECVKEEGEACKCLIKDKEVEHWFIACRTGFKDRRENNDFWLGSEKRRRGGLRGNA